MSAPGALEVTEDFDAYPGGVHRTFRRGQRLTGVDDEFAAMLVSKGLAAPTKEAATEPVTQQIARRGKKS